jgi:hypothetical protein
MTDIIPLVDSAARSLTNLQFAQEAHGIPRMWMAGVKKEDFVDADGSRSPSSRRTSTRSTRSPTRQGKVGQLTAADLKNFETSLNIYGSQASVATGFPAQVRDLRGQPAHRGLDPGRGDRPRPLRGGAERGGRHDGRLGRRAGAAVRHWREVEGNQVRVDWFDPATPTSRSVRTRWRSARRPASCPARATGTSSAGPRRARPRSAPTSRPSDGPADSGAVRTGDPDAAATSGRRVGTTSGRSAWSSGRSREAQRSPPREARRRSPGWWRSTRPRRRSRRSPRSEMLAEQAIDEAARRS